MATAINSAFGGTDGSITKHTDFLFTMPDTSMRVLHQPPDGTATFDEVWLWVFSTHQSYYVSFGMGTNSNYANSGASQNMYFPSSSPPWLVCAGWLMQDDEDRLGVRTEQNSYGKWHGYVNRITN